MLLVVAATPGIAPYLGMAAAVCGFIGSIVILVATWRTIELRRMVIKISNAFSADVNLADSVELIKRELNKEQLAELVTEHNLYLLGAFLLAVGFVLAFVREFL